MVRRTLTAALLLAAATVRAELPVPAEHPRLLGGRADFERIRETAKTDPLLAAGVRAVVDHAAHYAKQPAVVRKMTGRRLLTVCREALKHIAAESMAYRLTGERRYFEAAVRQMDAACGFTDWNPNHFLDVSEMSLAVALGYDWLYGDLTDEQRDRFAAGLKKHGYDEFVRDGASRRSRLKAGNNWGQVCNCGAIAAALALWERVDAAEAEEMVRRSVQRLRHPMRVYAPKGSYPEGPGYWEYGTAFNVVAIALLEHACGTDFGLGDVEGFKASAYYRDWVTGPSGQMFNYSDSGLTRGLAVPAWWFAAHGEPACIDYFERDALRRVAGWRKANLPREFPCMLFCMRDRKAAADVPRPRVWTSDDETGIAVLRSEWTTNAWFAAFKYGYVGGPHGHLDVGSFVFDALGERWAADIGSEDYNRIEQMGLSLWSMKQDSDRWKLYRLSNASHNVVNPEGVLQNVGSTGKLVYARDRDGVCEAAFDLDAIYRPAIGGWKRRTFLSHGSFRVEDAVTGLGGKSVPWGFATRAKAEVDGRQVVLTQNGKTVVVRAEAPSDAVWTAGPAQGGHPADAKNGGWTRVTLAAPSVGDKVVYKVAFSPKGE